MDLSISNRKARCLRCCNNAHVWGVDILTGKRYEERLKLHYLVEIINAINISKADYTLIDIDDEGFVSLLDNSGNLR